MQILNIIFTIVAVIANAAMTYFAITAWFELRRMKRDFAGVKRAMVVTTTITVANHVKDSFCPKKQKAPEYGVGAVCCFGDLVRRRC